LSTSLTIVKAHHGAIRVTSTPATGSRFLVYLPSLPSVAGPSVSTPRRRSDPAPRGNGELVLVVDDEPEVRSLTRRLLEAHGYRVLVAVDGADALSLFTSRQGDVALVITDMMMPGMDGAQLSEAVLQLAPRLPVIGVSGLAHDSRSARAIAAGAGQFLQKPYSADQLLRAVRGAVARR
jgi:CheY-like chemotaxis protein